MSTERQPAKPAKPHSPSKKKDPPSADRIKVYDEKPAGQQRKGKAEVFEPGVEG